MQKLELGAEYNPDDTAVTSNSSSTPTTDRTQAAAPLATNRVTKNQPMPKMNPRLPIIISIIAIAAGVLTGFGASKLQTKADVVTGPDGQPIQQIAEAGSIKNGDVFGSPDGSAFKDTAEGYLQIGGLEGEGSHQLLRPGGVSQTVYLVSTVTDLDTFEGMTIKVWGETYKGQNVGWLMDVGRVEVVNTQGQNPTAE